MLSLDKKLQISKDVLIDVESFRMKVNEGFREGRITEGEFYSAIGLHRIELALDVVINRLASLSDALSQ
ncbi:hypothetical protein KAV79_07680 [Candidatus Aerophobetes bacterium]|nr:hypothetical protein [Candidatus Aerophobetes bacterium]